MDLKLIDGLPGFGLHRREGGGHSPTEGLSKARSSGEIITVDGDEKGRRVWRKATKVECAVAQRWRQRRIDGECCSNFVGMKDITFLWG